MKNAIWIQSLKQIWGRRVLKHKLHGAFPNTGNYHAEVKYSLPFRGAWVVANGGITQKTSHSWDIPSQRYAYDFIILDKAGRSFGGKETEPSSFYCYGKDILAPADGTVAEVRVGEPDSRVTKDRAACCAARDIRGNYILIRHTENEYSLLAHLKPGSILVSAGQTVKRGDKVAECGNSGNTTEPHLHFQVQLGKSFYTSPGLPVEFERIAAKETPKYEKFDARRLRAPGASAYPPYIEVGQTVYNVSDPVETE